MKRLCTFLIILLSLVAVGGKDVKKDIDLSFRAYYNSGSTTTGGSGDDTVYLTVLPVLNETSYGWLVPDEALEGKETGFFTWSVSSGSIGQVGITFSLSDLVYHDGSGARPELGVIPYTIIFRTNTAQIKTPNAMVYLDTPDDSASSNSYGCAYRSQSAAVYRNKGVYDCYFYDFLGLGNGAGSGRTALTQSGGKYVFSLGTAAGYSTGGSLWYYPKYLMNSRYYQFSNNVGRITATRSGEAFLLLEETDLFLAGKYQATITIGIMTEE